MQAPPSSLAAAPCSSLPPQSSLPMPAIPLHAPSVSGPQSNRTNIQTPSSYDAGHVQDPLSQSQALNHNLPSPNSMQPNNFNSVQAGSCSTSKSPDALAKTLAAVSVAQLLVLTRMPVCPWLACFLPLSISVFPSLPRSLPPSLPLFQSTLPVTLYLSLIN